MEGMGVVGHLSSQASHKSSQVKEWVVINVGQVKYGRLAL